jgi:hypothetical protein
MKSLAPLLGLALALASCGPRESSTSSRGNEISTNDTLRMARTELNRRFPIGTSEPTVLRSLGQPNEKSGDTYIYRWQGSDLILTDRARISAIEIGIQDGAISSFTLRTIVPVGTDIGMEDAMADARDLDKIQAGLASAFPPGTPQSSVIEKLGPPDGSQVLTDGITSLRYAWEGQIFMPRKSLVVGGISVLVKDGKVVSTNVMTIGAGRAMPAVK